MTSFYSGGSKFCSSHSLEILLVIIPVRVLNTVFKQVIGWYFLTSLLSPNFGSKDVITVVSQSGTFYGSSIIAL